MSRKIGERIILRLTEPLPAGATLEILVCDIQEHPGRKARIGVAAPQSVEINREEIDLLKHGGAGGNAGSGS